MLRITAVTLALLATFLTAGCTTKVKTAPMVKVGSAPHAHPDEGPHEGCLIEWGGDSLHGEFTVDHAKKEAIVYILDDTATKAGNVKPEEITDLVLVIKNATPPATIQLKHDPMRSDAKGIAFAGTHESLAKEMEYKGELSGKVKGVPYSASFAEKAEHEHKDKK